MEDLTYLQKSILNKLLPNLIKTEPYEELLRVSLLFREIKEIKNDRVLFEQFKTIINNQLYFHLKSKEEFYDLDRFKDIYKTLVEEFIEDNIDADENDFIEKYINSQQEIINKTIEYFIPVSGYESLELIQFLKKDFFDEFIRGSKNKIEFLKEDKLGLKKEVRFSKITTKNKKIFEVLERVNLEIEFLREVVTITDFIKVLTEDSDKEIHLNIDHRNFHYLLTKIKEYFFNFTITAVAKTNKIHSKRGNLLKANNLINAKGDYPSLMNDIDEVFKNFK
jgi:hypothetical protein